MSENNTTFANGAQDFANDTPMQTALREIRSFIFSSNNLIAYLCASVICVLVAPFSSAEMSLPVLIAYWFTSNAVTIAAGEIIMVGTAVIAPRSQPALSIWIFAGAVLSGLAVTCLVFIVNLFFYPNPSNLPGLLSLAKTTWPIGFFIALAVSIISERQRAQTNANVTSSEPEVAFFKRLPVHMGKQLISVEAEDHYVKVTTTKASKMLLVRFSDAMEELAEYPGIQIHRSYWVARDAVTKDARKQGRLHLILSNGTELPVSRGFAAETKAYFRLG